MFGAISGVVSFGIGTLATQVSASLTTQGITGFSNALIKGAVQASLHGLSGATMAVLQGAGPQDALAGFTSGFIGSSIGSVLGDGASPFLTIGAAGVTGGIASEISGGKFADGFRNGVIEAGLNHVAHRFNPFPKEDPNDAFKKFFSSKVGSLGKELSNFGTVGDLSSVSGSLALGYRQSLSVTQRVGMNGNLAFISAARGISRITGPAANAGAVINIVQSSNNYQSGAISGARHSWNLASNIAPVIIGSEVGGVYGAAAGLIFAGIEFAYNQVNSFFDSVYSNMTWPDLGNIGVITRGFGMVR